MVKNAFRRSFIASFVSINMSLLSSVHASIVRNDIDYQYFRDFAENKGLFHLGATNVTIQDKNGQTVGTMLKDVPMLDFSAMSRSSGFSTLIDPQYIVSVSHNAGYKTVEFGVQGFNPDAHHYSYQLVDRNDYPQDAAKTNTDYHVPRLSKLVTEVVPATVTSAGMFSAPYLDSNRFPIFVRAGSGIQAVRDKDGKTTNVASSYSFLTGGSTLKILRSNPPYFLDYSDNLYAENYGPMSSYATPGDSGSGTYAFDKKENRWVLVSVLNAYSGMEGNFNRASLMRHEYHQQKMREDSSAQIHNNSQYALYTWQAKGNTSTLSHGNNKFEIALADRSILNNDHFPEGTAGVKEVNFPQENHGKNLHFSGQNATIELKSHIDQGAGALYFDTNLTFRPESDQTWLGAGVVVGKGKQVNWQVKNPEGDRLSKLGEGTLYVNGIGENRGDISVGDGTLILAQRADSQGRKQAFHQVGIVSGRPTVVLNSADQVNPDNIYFGSRGGRLDLNGNSLHFHHIQHSDSGAKIVNNQSSRASTLTISGKLNPTANSLRWGEWSKGGADIYSYANPWVGYSTNYFVLKGNPSGFYPANTGSNNDWEFLSKDKDTAINIVLDRLNQANLSQSFSGFIGENRQDKVNGELNVRYIPEPLPRALSQLESKRLFAFTGGMNLNGNFSVEGGNVLLSGQPTPHAYDQLNWQEVIYEHDWQNSNFNARNMNVQGNSRLIIGRNVAVVNSNFTAQNQAKLHLGFIQEQTPSCYHSEFTGNTQCTAQVVLSEQNFANLPTTQIQGNTVLNAHSQLMLGKANLIGTIHGNQQSQVYLNYASHWQNMGNSRLGSLQAEAGSRITLNPDYTTDRTPSHFNTLHIYGNFSGATSFNYLTDIANMQGDKVEIHGVASGIITLALRNIGKEPNTAASLSLLRLTHANQKQHNISVVLERGYVDLGAYRYILANRNYDYRLYNPLKEVEDSMGQHDNSQAIAQAEKEAEQQRKRIAALTASVSRHKQTTLQAQQTRNKVQQNLSQAEIELNRVYQRVNTVSAFVRFFLRGKLNKTQHKFNQIEKEFNQANRNTIQAEQQLKEVQKQLADAQQNIQALQQQLTELQKTHTSKALMKRRFEQLCRENNSDCSLIPISTDNEEMDEQAFKQLLSDIETAFTTAQKEVTAAQQELEGLQQNHATATNIQSRAAQLCHLNATACDNAISRYARQADWSSRYANTAISELSAQANMALQMGQNLDRQLFTHNDKVNVWANYEQQKTEHQSALYRPYKQKTHLNQVGAEMPLANGFSLGAVISNNRSANEYNESATGKSSLNMATIYGKWKSANGTFAALDFNAGRAKNHIELDGESRFSRNIQALGFNLGQEFNLAGVQIQPSVGMRFYRFSAASYQLNGTDIHTPRSQFMTYQAGVKLSKAFELNGFSIKPNAAAYYVDANQKRLSVKVNNHEFSQQFGRYIKAETGVAVGYDQWQLALDAGLLKGNEIGKQHFAAMKLSYSW